MSFGLMKDNKFEIIAVFREELLKKTKLELKYANTSVVTQLEKVDFEHFVIPHHKDIVTKKIQTFILHSENGIIKFNARIDQEMSDGMENALAYFIPEMVFLIQRRQHQRFSFLKGHSFNCFGRYKNGENYSFKIKNMSRGGCALIAQDANTRFLYKDAVIKGVSLDFEQFGYLQLDLKVVDVVMVNEFDAENQLYSCYQVSCRFDFKNSREEAEIERIIISFLMGNKVRRL